jgi:hypothetical protein
VRRFYAITATQEQFDLRPVFAPLAVAVGTLVA